MKRIKQNILCIVFRRSICAIFFERMHKSAGIGVKHYYK